jgi:hypothetical protein
MNNLNEKIDFFFKSPTDEPIGPNFSYLYLLRRDIFTSLGYDPNTMKPINYRVLWPGLMCILAGIDLLGKYLEGDDINTSVSFRFKEYYKKYFNNKENVEIIYQLRNSMLHSFGLYSFTSNKKVKKQEYFFILDIRDDNSIVTHQNNTYTINIIALCNAFEISVDKYLEDLRSNDMLKINFEKMFPFYAGISTRQ